MKMTLISKRTELERETNRCEPPENRHSTHQLFYRKTILSFLSLLLLFIGVGCTHQMRVKNLSDFSVSPTSTGNSFDVALAPYKGSEELRSFYSETLDALNRHPDIKTVRGQWTLHGVSDEFNPEYIVDLDISANYKGSGWNYPITFPGCYLFICAANGYVYKADVTTDILISHILITDPPSSSTDKESTEATDNASPPLTDMEPVWATDDASPPSADKEPTEATDNSSPSSTGIQPAWAMDDPSASGPTCTTPLLCSDCVPMNFNFRHCSYKRGFWSGSAWWMPGYGLHNLITGFVYVGYDKSATKSFVDKSDEKYGAYIADKIVSMIVNEQKNKEEITRLYLE